MIRFSQLREKIEAPSKEHTLGVARRDMPQIDKEHMPSFIRALKKQGINVSHKTMDSHRLTATQGQFNKSKVQDIVDSIKAGKADTLNNPIITSGDGFVLDGHHRWLAHVNLNMAIDCCVIDKPATEVLQLMHDHPESYTEKLYDAVLVMYHQKYELFEAETCPLISAEYLKEFEKFVDRMFSKFKIDFDFTKHFRERIAHERNNPCITMKEIAAMIQKLYKERVAGGNSLKKYKDSEAVIKDMQSDLNMPVAIEYNAADDELRVAAKTIMRKKNFSTPNPIIKV